MRSKKAFMTMLSSSLLQIVTIVAGLIVPRMIIGTYGSDANGMIASIKQFLEYIVLLEAGAGGVVRAALYKPLATKDTHKISAIIKATEHFFRKIGYILIGYLLLMTLVFPLLVNTSYDFLYTASLILIIGVGVFFQYFFGITYQLLLQADQRKYKMDLFQIVTALLNATILVGLVSLNFPIHMVQLTSSLIFIARPLALKWYVKKYYHLEDDVAEDNEAIKQRRDGFGHHIAFFLHNNTDIAILSIFSNTKEVSIYAVYNMVIISINRIIAIFSQGLEAAFGNMIANQEQETLEQNFNLVELAMFFLTTVLFTSTAILIIPFIKLYTIGIDDANYIRPLFAYLLIGVSAAFCIRIPYHSVVLAAGHFKETKKGAYLEAGLNVVLSLVLVNRFGLEGITLGTFVATVYRTLDYVHYLSITILHRNKQVFVKRLAVFLLAAGISIYLSSLFAGSATLDFVDWLQSALVITTTTSVVTLSMMVLFLQQDTRSLFTRFNGIIRRTVKMQKSH